MSHQALSTVAYIALGANLGDRARNIREALRRLGETRGVVLMRTSGNYENLAVGGPPDSPPFLNAVAEVRTSLEPDALLTRLLQIESELGRVRRDRWEPRPIDLDLVLYGDRVLRSDRLTLPHPGMHERRFVLVPLAEIAPDAVHPALHATAAELLARLGPTA